MLDTIKMGMLRLDMKSSKSHGYLRIILKNGELKSYFRIPLHVAFDLIGYNTYKESLRKENPEFKTWVSNVVLTIPPDPEHSQLYTTDSGHEWFLGNLRTLASQYPCFPKSLAVYVQDSIQMYLQAKKNTPTSGFVPEDYIETIAINTAEVIAAERALTIFGQLQRSRFDPGRPEKLGEFEIQPFCRDKGEKSAKEIIEIVTEAVADYVLENPKVSKFTETEGGGLRIKLTSMFLECFYKEQIRFMKKKLELGS